MYSFAKGIIIILLIRVPLDAAAIALCWNYFVEPFLNAPHMGFGMAVGFRLLLTAMIYIPHPANADEAYEAAQLFAGFARPLIVMLLAFIVHTAMG